MKIVGVHVTITMQDDDGEPSVLDVLDWKDEGPGRSLDIRYSWTRPMAPLYDVGVDKPVGTRTDGPTYFKLEATKNGPPEVLPATEGR